MIVKKARKKRQFYKHLSIILFIGSAVVLVLLVLFERGQDIDAVGQMAEETIAYLKGTCQRYDNYHIGIDTDARENLLDKSKILREYMTEEFLEDDKELLKFAKLQNLTGIYIVDQNLNTVAQTDIRGIKPEKLWRKQLKTESKKNIVTNTVETFSEKIREGKIDYYVAMISRKNTKGMIICYQIADELSTDKYSSSFSELMKNNTFHKNPRILITNGSDILSTNAEYLKEAKSFKDIPELDVNWSEHKLTKINFEGKKLYGMRQVYKQYYIYVCYESSEVFSNLIPVVTVGIAIYIFCLMSMVVIRQNMRERNIMEQARQIQTIKAISSLYVSTALLDLETKECTPINGIRGMATLAKYHLGEPGKEAEYIDKIITSSDYLLDIVNDVLQMNKLESGRIYFENKHI